MGGERIEYAYLGDILKYEEQEDGSLMVYGKATGPDLDLDRQVCDPEWLKGAMPKWFEYGNVREQHSNIAAGVGVEMEERDGSYFVKSHIVDAGTVRKVKNKTLKGYSVGIRNGAIVKDKSAPGGRICKGEIYELSLVDRPANPACTINIVKALGDGPELSFMDAEDGQFGRIGESEPLDFDELTKGAAAIEAAEGQRDAEGGRDDDGGEDDADDFEDVGEPDDEPDDEPDGGLSLFDGLDDDAEDYEGGKGLLDTLLNGPDRKTKRGPGGKFAGSRKKNGEAEERRKQRAKERAEREEQRKRRVAENMADAEREADARRAERSGRHREAAEHRGDGRVRVVRKALDLVELDDDARAYAGRTRLVRSILDMPLDIDKAAGEHGGHDEADDIEGAREVIAQIAELIISEATALAEGRYEEIDDIRMLLEAIEAVKRFCHREMRQAGMDWTEIERTMEPVPGSYAKAVGGAPSTPVDTDPDAAATLMQAEITKAVAKVTEAYEVQLRELDTRLAQHEARQIPGGPQLVPAHLLRVPNAASADVPANIHKAADYRRLAALPGVDPGVAASYRAAAEQLERAA